MSTTRRKISTDRKKHSKYAYYERSVQSPDYHAKWFGEIYADLRGKPAHAWREDFCGTFAMSSEWLKLDPKNTAIGVDLDPEPLNYGKSTHLPKLTTDQRKRIKLLNKNVLSVVAPKVDLILACNFSYCIFKQRELLVRYLRGCLKSLRKDGVMILDLAGGPGMIEQVKERKQITDKKLGRFVYVWDQKSFDPIGRNARYGIHFKFPDGSQMHDAFTYDWRLWTIPELRDALAEAGFSRSVVYWETEHKGEGTGEYLRADAGDNAFAWVAYIAGMKE